MPPSRHDIEAEPTGSDGENPVPDTARNAAAEAGGRLLRAAVQRFWPRRAGKRQLDPLTTSDARAADHGSHHTPRQRGDSQRLDPASPAAKKKRDSSRNPFPEEWLRDNADSESLPTIEHTGVLPLLTEPPACLVPSTLKSVRSKATPSCAYCGVGDSEKGPERRSSPTPGCSKLKLSAGTKGGLYPIHLAPSIQAGEVQSRSSITYEQGIARLADLILDHRDPGTQILVYGCGQIDYFTVFALQEVFRLLGVRNIAGNAEHCLNAGAVHNEMLTGQEGPFLTFENALAGENRFYLFNGWNGLVSHPGAWSKLAPDPKLDAYVIDVMESETAQEVRRLLGEERVILVRPRSDSHLALAVAHELLTKHDAPHQDFLDRFADQDSWNSFRALAMSDRFEPHSVAARIAPEPHLEQRILNAIVAIAARLADPNIVPINIPSVGLSQTSGAVAHCLWGSVMAMVGKYGLKAPGEPAGGTLRIPGQINAQTEVQGLSSRFFFGRIPVDHDGAADAARRMGLPDEAYELAVRDEPRVSLDYSEPDVPYDRELIICFGTQFEANMMNRERWLAKLELESTTLVVVDPIPDPFSLKNAHLVIPSPPHAATPKLYQNGEWRMTLSMPRRERAEQTRSDATIIYDTMGEISRRIRTDSMLRMVHPDLGLHSQSGYLRRRFEPPEREGLLPRHDGEVCRAHLWQRVLDYLGDASERRGELYCMPRDDSGEEISWERLLREGNLLYGSVGTRRYLLDYSDPAAVPFKDIFGAPGSFRFFTPSEDDLSIPQGVVLNSGRASMTSRPADLRYAINTFNSGKATPADDMPKEHPLHLSLLLAEELEISNGDSVRVTNLDTGRSMVFRALRNARLSGKLLYFPFHKDRAQLQDERYINTITSHVQRCPYTAQTRFKATEVSISRI